MPTDTRLLAVLIDGDNTSPRFAKAIFGEVGALGAAKRSGR